MTAAPNMNDQPQTKNPSPPVPPLSDDGFGEFRPARILVVDDQPANVQIIGAMLGALGHEIVPAADGLTAIKRIAMRPPDLILLDLLMPVMDGFDCARPRFWRH